MILIKSHFFKIFIAILNFGLFSSILRIFDKFSKIFLSKFNSEFINLLCCALIEFELDGFIVSK